MTAPPSKGEATAGRDLFLNLQKTAPPGYGGEGGRRLAGAGAAVASLKLGKSVLEMPEFMEPPAEAVMPDSGGAADRAFDLAVMYALGTDLNRAAEANSLVLACRRNFLGGRHPSPRVP
ncbi:MAG: hypothetical protein LBQ12_11920 [Deltaproteobacteria bacterium]|jgi:hypothetical protein|nr:hypothetical protein [Deltaproteobacteria bacterium]